MSDDKFRRVPDPWRSIIGIPLFFSKFQSLYGGGEGKGKLRIYLSPRAFI